MAIHQPTLSQIVFVLPGALWVGGSEVPWEPGKARSHVAPGGPGNCFTAAFGPDGILLALRRLRRAAPGFISGGRWPLVCAASTSYRAGVGGLLAVGRFFFALRCAPLCDLPVLALRRSLR